jgi:hypothetical protein
MNVELSKATLAMYMERLSSLTREQVESASRKTIDEWDQPSKMPPLKFILDRTGPSPKLLAEQAWAFVEPYVEKNWHPDLGWAPGKDKALTPAMLYAIRQTGGLTRIYNEASPYVRKDFIAAFERFTIETGAQMLLAASEARHRLALGAAELEGE